MARRDVGIYSQALNLADTSSILVRVTEYDEVVELGRHATLRMSCPLRRGSSTLPFVTLLQVRQVPSWVS